MPKISPHAIVECAANLADDTVVGPFSYIGPEVHIGSGTRIDGNVTLNGRVQIGADCHIFPFAVVGQVDANGEGAVNVGDRCNIREHAVVRCGVQDGAGTRVGNDALVMTGCYIGPDARIDDHVVLGNYSYFADRSRVEAHVWAAAFTGAGEGVTIGRYSFTSGYAGIDRDAPPFAVLQGYPFRIRGVNVLNLRRCGFDEKQITRLKEAFRALFDETEGRAADAAVAALAARDDLDEHLQYLAEYLQQHNPAGPRACVSPGSGRGI